MEIIITSLLAVAGVVLVSLFIVPRFLWLTTGIGNSVRFGFEGDGTASSGVSAPFLVMASLLIGWAYLWFYIADVLAGEDFGNRWVLLFCALGLAGLPYDRYQRQARSGIAMRLTPPLDLAMEYAGGIQSLLIASVVLSGYYFDWWEYLPG
jgi:hypothetical protein